jgi:lactate dehydrogenase-like 2-hydroxyacid dehydrogenase
MPREPPTKREIGLFSSGDIGARTIITPHCAWATEPARDALAQALQYKILDWVGRLEEEGRLPRHGGDNTH